MLEGFDRYLRRQRDLATGVDADLVQGNRRKFRLAISLIGVAFLLLGIDRIIKPHGLIQEVFGWLLGVLLVSGTLIAMWAGQERAFLDKPEPKKPSSLFK